jgi:hypothetical protein
LQHDLFAHGVALAPRAEALDPPPPPVDYGTAVDPMGIAIAALVIGFGLIEVCLLAGTAFAVGARRQVRDLGLVAAAGGEARHVRRIVLAQGVVTARSLARGASARDRGGVPFPAMAGAVNGAPKGRWCDRSSCPAGRLGAPAGLAPCFRRSPPAGPGPTR